MGDPWTGARPSSQGCNAGPVYGEGWLDGGSGLRHGAGQSMHVFRYADTNAFEPGRELPSQPPWNEHNVRKKGDNPVDALAGEIWAYSTQGSRELQEDRLAFVTQQRAASISWLTLSDCPFFHGW